MTVDDKLYKKELVTQRHQKAGMAETSIIANLFLHIDYPT